VMSMIANLPRPRSVDSVGPDTSAGPERG
jgi:hypothetical protein